MSREERAKQFAPFDAFKGLHEALRLKEYEHERVLKGEINEEQAEKISKVLINYEKGQVVRLIYYDNGHYKEIIGQMVLNLYLQKVEINKINIDLNNVCDLEVVEG